MPTSLRLRDCFVMERSVSGLFYQRLKPDSASSANAMGTLPCATLIKI
jgi:hypothetical protein